MITIDSPPDSQILAKGSTVTFSGSNGPVQSSSFLREDTFPEVIETLSNWRSRATATAGQPWSLTLTIPDVAGQYTLTVVGTQKPASRTYTVQ